MSLASRLSSAIGHGIARNDSLRIAQPHESVDTVRLRHLLSRSGYPHSLVDAEGPERKILVMRLGVQPNGCGSQKNHLSKHIRSFMIYRRSWNPRPSKIAGIAFSIRAVRVADCFAPAK